MCGCTAMRRNSRRPLKSCAALWTKIDPRATSSFHEPDRSAGRRSAWNDHGSGESPKNEACKNWLASLAYSGVETAIPEIAHYEVRRELLRAGKERGLVRLDALKGMPGLHFIQTPRESGAATPTRAAALHNASQFPSAMGMP